MVQFLSSHHPWCKFLCGLVHPLDRVPLPSRVLCQVAVCLTSHHVSHSSSYKMTSCASTFTLDVSALSSSLAFEESHTILIHFYGDAEGTVPTLEIYAKVFLAETYRIDHYEELEHAPLILKAELYLYFTADGGLAERYPPRLIDWQQRLQAILDSIQELAPILEEELA